MKKTIALLLAMAQCMGLAACGAAETPETVTPSQSVATLPAQTETVTTEAIPSPFRVIDYDDPNWFVNAHIQDLDGDWPTLYLDDRSSKEAMIGRGEWYFDHLLTDTAVTDVMLCVFEQLSFVESDTMDWIHEKIANRTQAGQASPGLDHVAPLFTDFYRAVTEYDLDWCQLAIDQCNQAGVRPWIYLRMNDLHGARYGAESVQHDDFWYEAQAKGWLLGDGYGTLVRSTTPTNAAYDFSHEEVRAWMLAYIEEMLMRYDVFGLQLDFMRNIYCFRYLEAEDYAPIMTQFIRDVNVLLEKAEAHHGHDMKLMIRLGADVANNLTFGFDVKTWAQEGLMDAVVPSPEDFTGSGTPIRKWIEAVGDDIAVFPGFENNLIPMTYYTKLAHIKGIAAGYMQQGAHGLYFNNYYQLGSEGPAVYPLSPAEASQGPRTFIISRQDLVPIGETGYSPLPLALDRGGRNLEISMGPVAAGENIRISIGYDSAFGGIPPERITLNGAEPLEVKEVQPTAYGTAGFYLDAGYKVTQAETLMQYTFSNVSSEDILTVYLPVAPGCTVVSLEIHVSPF